LSVFLFASISEAVVCDVLVCAERRLACILPPERQLWAYVEVDIEIQDKMAEYQSFQTAYRPRTPDNFHELSSFPYWARSQVQYAQNLLAISSEPIEYDDEDEDYQDNYFFFPEDCSYPPSKEANNKIGFQSALTLDHARCDKMTALPDIKMIDTEALSDLLEDNLSPPEITSIL
jgi:hypothetical protein